jgi:hypothetical protein
VGMNCQSPGKLAMLVSTRKMTIVGIGRREYSQRRLLKKKNDV